MPPPPPPHPIIGKWGQISVDLVCLFLCHGAPLCTSAPIEGLHMYHQPCSMTNYICEMRLWGGLPSQSLLSGNVYRFQHEVLHYVSVWKRERCQLRGIERQKSAQTFFLLYVFRPFTCGFLPSFPPLLTSLPPATLPPVFEASPHLTSLFSLFIRLSGR